MSLPTVTTDARAWIDGPLREHSGCVPVVPPARWRGLEELVQDQDVLTALHSQLLLDRSATPQAAAKWLLSWSAGLLAGAVGFGLAQARAGLVVRAQTLRWGVHEGGWFDRVDLGGSTVAVAPGHPWAGAAEVEVLADDDAVRRRAVSGLVAVVEPLVARVRRLARVGATSLWSEVADGLGLALLHRTDLPVTEEGVAQLRAAVAVPGTPWRQRPRLELVDTDLVGQKGGCCLAFQCPPPGSAPEYCSTCSLRPFDTCAALQRSALEAQRQARHAAAGDASTVPAG